MRTTRGYRFTPKNLNKILKNRAYIGEYSYGGYVIEDGMPRLVEDDVFEEVQRRFAINKRRGAKTKAELAAQGDDAPDYWLTGHAYCLTCGGPMEGVSGTSKTGRKYRYYYCLNQRKKQCTAKTVRKDEIEARVEEIVESFLAEPDMLASLAVDLADHYKQTHGRGDEILKALEARRTDVEAKLANFVKAISKGIFNDTTAEAMRSLEEQKHELDAAIQAEHVKATLFEDEASIGAFYRRFAQATIDTPETREQLFEYFVDKVFIGRDQIVVASYFHDSTAAIEFEDLEEALTSGHRTGEVRTYARKREFNTSPSGGDAGNRTPVRRPAPKSSPGAVCCFISQPLTSCRPAASRLSRLSVEACSSTRHATSGSQNDARHQAGSTTWADGLRVHAAISGGENVVGAILFGTYWFERIVNELSEHPRPASLRSTTVVETDHPLLSFHSSGPLRSRKTVRIRRVHRQPHPHKR